MIKIGCSLANDKLRITFINPYQKTSVTIDPELSEIEAAKLKKLFDYNFITLMYGEME